MLTSVAVLAIGFNIACAAYNLAMAISRNGYIGHLEEQLLFEQAQNREMRAGFYKLSAQIDRLTDKVKMYQESRPITKLGQIDGV